MANTAKQQDISLLNINLSNARSENESYEDYRIRLTRNKQILRTYFTMGREAFREMFPNGVAEAITDAKAKMQTTTDTETVTETVQVPGSLHLGDE